MKYQEGTIILERRPYKDMAIRIVSFRKQSEKARTDYVYDLITDRFAEPGKVHTEYSRVMVSDRLHEFVERDGAEVVDGIIRLPENIRREAKDEDWE